MKSEEIRKRFLNFFEKRGHAIIPSASLVPENDPSALFISAGMQPLVPYLLGQSHPQGVRLANVQKCVRTQDIEEVGDKTHDTFFEMLGNWSLGDYFKKEAIEWSYEFLTSEEIGLGLDPNRIYITIFEGNEDADRDDESKKLWEGVGIPSERIFPMDAKSNWWSPGDNGPSGPDTEMFYDIRPNEGPIRTKDDFIQADKTARVVEIWNDVFMEYEKRDGKVVGKLSQKNVDTGAGLERMAMVMQEVDSVFETDLFAPIMEKIDELSKNDDIRAKRIVADHVRTAVFMIADGVMPSNTDRGYVLRRIIRRAVRYADKLGIESSDKIVATVSRHYENNYPEVADNEAIGKVIGEEGEKFRATLERGMREFEKISEKDISGKTAFDLYQSYGFPVEMTKELADDKGMSVDEDGFWEEMDKHKELSRTGAEKKFKGGLAGHSEKEVQYHTATHLLNAALHKILGDNVAQKGSNITPERLRFDFSHHEKVTPEEQKQIEDLVNKAISDNLPVTVEEMSPEEAKESGALGVFGDKYGDVVKVFSIGDFSKEICGGPHVDNTGELGHFKITKEEASSAGVRRIKAVLE